MAVHHSAVEAIAIIGMSGRWPRARNVTEFWRNVRDGIDCISRFTGEELQVPEADRLIHQPDYVKARSVLEDADIFDADFFGILPKEAALIDPQQRVFLECCWEALEDAGYDPQGYSGAIGVFGGSSTNTYFLSNLCADRDFIEDYVGVYPLGNYPTMLGAIADSLSTRVSYKLNLRGPSMTTQSACSTSLVAVCQACQSLLTYQSDMALAGGVSITFPQKRGYFYQEGGMGSADGYCRPFDADAQGTVFGSGAGVVLLKRLEDALADGDHVYAVIRGFAVNNDGFAKVGYTAPSIDGQANVIAMAHALAGVEPESIGYVESHGTATPLGDPIEFAALTRAFRAQTDAKGFCALGAVKANVGHLEAAAGVTGLISAVQALVHEQLPPVIGFRKANPAINLANSPFYVNTRLTPWQRGASPRRAGVSSFGVGGTNAHVVLEEAPPVAPVKRAHGAHLLILSGRSATALDEATGRLREHLKAYPQVDLDSVAYTLQVGRRAFEHRRSVVCSDVDDAIRALERPQDTRRLHTGVRSAEAPSVIFMFPGQGSQYSGMAAGLYRDNAQFRRDIDHCAELLEPHLGQDLRAVLYADAQQSQTAERDLRDTALAQPALFAVQYALARLWMRWGVQPSAMIGHSVGEFVAACLAGVFSLEDGLEIITTRSRLMQLQPPGCMLSVRLGADEVTPLLNGKLSLAAANSPRLSVVSGAETAIASLEQVLVAQGIPTRRLATSHAFHSRMMDPIIEPFTDHLRRFKFRVPRMPFISGVTGTWITELDATDARYWARHSREPVQFSKGIQQLRSEGTRLFLEVGPGRTLCTLVRQHQSAPSEVPPVASFSHVVDQEDDLRAVLNAAGILWVHGVPMQWSQLHDGGARRCSLPTYPFERKRFWIDPPPNRSPRQPPRDANTDMTIETQQRTQSSDDPMTASTPVASPRVDRLRATLVEILEGLSGSNLAGCDPSMTFVEMGFDSLFLTQVTQALQSRFGLRVTFRQLLAQESTIEGLASYIDSKLPGEASAAESVIANTSGTTAAPATIAPVPLATSSAVLSASTTAGEIAVAAIVREQLQAMTQLMARQLEVFRVTGSAVEVPSLTAIAASTSRAPSAATESKESGPAREFKAFGPYKPVVNGRIDGLTEQQAAHIDGLIKRYTTRTAQSKAYTQTHRRRLADPRVVSGFRTQWKEMVYPIVTVKSRGSRLWDLDGNEYIDILNGFGPIMFGHAPGFVTDAIAAQLHEGFEIGPQTALAGKVADLVCELTGNERVTFCNTGSEAVMAAIRLARTVTARTKIALFTGSYHGTFDEVLVKGIRKGNALQSLPIAPGIPVEKVANVIVLDYGTPESLAYIKQHAGELAAVLVEPVQSRHPALVPVEFLRELRAITEASGTALIFDEVVTGFRVHPGGVQALFGIRADLATYGKVAGGGMPIGILAGRAEFMDALDGGMWQYGDDSSPETGVTFFAGTFVRHPLALAATHAILARLKETGPELQQSLNATTTRFAQCLNTFLAEQGLGTRIEHFSSWFYFTLADQPFGSLLYYHLRDKGVHIQEGFPCFLTAAHSEADIEHVITAFKEGIAEMQAGGVLPAPALRATANIPAAPTAPPTEVPLTEAQLEVLLAARISDDASCAFNEAFTLKIRGNLNPSALREALAQLVQRHDALRSTFDPERRCLRVLDSVDIDLPIMDLSTQATEQRATQIEQLVRNDASEPFNLLQGPVVRFKLVKLQPDVYMLLFTTHHLVCDGWSTNVLLAELGDLYAARCSGAACNLSAPTAFRTYALDQARRMQSLEHAAVEAWWAEKFATPVSPLELPTDRPRGSVKSFNGATVRRKIGAESYQRIKRFGAQHGCTLFATMLAGFKILLHRLTGQSEIVVGTPAAGQSLYESESLVGHCVNFLPLRTSFAGNPSCQALIRQVRGTLLDAYDHQNYTYGSLVQKLGLRRDPSRLPLVEVQFNLERVGTELAYPGLEVEVDPCPKSFVNFDLFLNVVESNDGLVLDCDYNSDLFDATTVERWLDHLDTLLESLISHPGSEVAALDLLGAADRQRLLVEWNGTQADYPRDKCIHHLVGEQAARTPQAIAAVCGERELTYAQLDGAANRLAQFLRKRGARPGERVAICLDRSPEMIIGVLGILKSGAAYVPLDPDFPAERITTVLEDCNPSLLLTQADILSRLNLAVNNAVCLDSVWSEVSRERNEAPEQSAASWDLAYVIYTSGSTGKPKGVEIPHRAVVNLLCSMAQRPGLTAQDTLLAVTTLAFDIAALELYLPLCVGGRVVLATRETASDGNNLLSLLRTSGTTVMQATPATWRMLLEAGWNEASDLKVLCGGEALPRDLADQLLKRSSSVWNMYGPTETTIWSATSPVQPGTGPVTIGPPIANTTFYVLDEKARPLPLGVPGELHIGGEGLARGYWNRPQLMAEKFIPDAFSGDARDRLYKTGDLVRYRPDGTLEFLGRLDTQVKVRGFRIETAEVELALKQSPGVRECVVAAREDSPGDRRLVAYFVATSLAPATVDLRRFLSAKLPSYMVPSTFVALESMPQTPNGKIDRRALPVPQVQAAPREQQVALPRNADEKTLADIVSAVLNIQDFGIHDSIFDLGADSLKVFQIVTRANAAGLGLTPKHVLAERTIAAICDQLHKSGPILATGPQLVAIARDRYRVKRSESAAMDRAGD
jgi:amino acid adenylation domain-containing protein